MRNKEIIQNCVQCFETPYMRQKNYKSLIKNIQKHNIQTKKKFWKKTQTKNLMG